MRVLVIGGNRLFGKRLVTKLLDQGADVTLLNRGKLGDSFGDRVKRITIDRKDLSPSTPQLKNEKWDLIYDQACYEATDARGACETFSGRVSHYIFTSSQSVYEQKGNLTEDDFDPATYQFDTDADRNANYAESKRQCESVFTRLGAFSLSSFRFPFVTGEDDSTGRLRFHIERIATGQPLYFPNIEAKISLISSEDAARALLFASTLPQAAGALNCASPDPISLRGLVSSIEGLCNKSAVLLTEPNEKAHSPYGVEKDWWTRMDKIQSVGFHPPRLEAWLPQLIAAELELFQ